MDEKMDKINWGRWKLEFKEDELIITHNLKMDEYRLTKESTGWIGFSKSMEEKLLYEGALFFNTVEVNGKKIAFPKIKDEPETSPTPEL